MTDEQKNITNNSLDGKWVYEGDHQGEYDKVYVQIANESLLISFELTGESKKEITISKNAHWFGDYLCFTDGQRYFVRYADHEKMIFGEFSQPGNVGNPIWQYQFKRVL